MGQVGQQSGALPPPPLQGGWGGGARRSRSARWGVTSSAKPDQTHVFAVEDDGDWSDLARPSGENGGLTMIEAAKIYGVPLRDVRAAYVWSDLGKPDQWAVWYADPRTVRGFFGKPEERQVMASAAASRAITRAALLRERLRQDKP